ncbi:MAG: hypothetical protein FD171_74 [Actinobacteria bacterium]|nr:MAG: hypothetical protein FD171_74 [Actinomycetota bacterium]
MDEDRAVQLYREWRRLRLALPEKPRLATDARLKCAGLPFGDAFSVTAQQSIQDLGNFVNSFVFNLRRLRALTTLVVGLDENEQFDVVFELALPLAYYCLEAPAAIKGRCFHDIAVVSNHANGRLVPSWPDYGELGHSKRELAQYMAQFWDSWPPLHRALGTLNNAAYRRATRGFRNEFHHGAPNNIAMGSRRKHVRLPNGVEMLTVEAPVSLQEVVDALTPQTIAAVEVHERLVNLFTEQCGAMANKRIEQNAKS